MSVLFPFLQFSRDVRLYLIASGLFGFVLFGGIYPLLYNLYMLRLGYNTEFVGLANATGALFFAISCLPSGLIGGRWGSRFTMVVGICVAVVGYGALAQAEIVPPLLRNQFILATYSFGVMGIALFVVNGTPYLMAITNAQERNAVFAVQAALMPLSGFVGSMLGGVLPGYVADIIGVSLDHPSAYRYTLFVGSFCLIPAVFALLATKDVRDDRKQNAVEETIPLPYILIAITAFISVFHVAGEAAARTFFNVYMDDGLHIDLSLIGAQLAGAQLLAVPAALAFPYLSSRFGIQHLLVAVTAVTAVLLLGMAWVPHWVGVGFCFMVIMALAGLRRSAFAIFHQELVPVRWRTAMSGGTAMMSGVGYSAMALGGGYLIPAAGYASLFVTGALITAIGSFLFWIYFRKDRAVTDHTELRDLSIK